LSEAEAYLEEAVAAFYADCLFASCVMLGVAAEAEFLRLVDVACASATYGATFSSVAKPLFIRQKIARFLPALRPLIPSLPNESTEDIDTNFSMIQSILRIARNDTGHPTAASPKREQVYVNLQLFPPFCATAYEVARRLGLNPAKWAIFHKAPLSDDFCRRPIKMSPLCQL